MSRFFTVRVSPECDVFVANADSEDEAIEAAIDEATSGGFAIDTPRATELFTIGEIERAQANATLRST